MSLSGGKILAKALNAQGVERIFCVAGESYLPVLDGLLDFPDIKVVTCRHESGATFMAEADAQMIGKVGVAMATRGPGACNASIGVHAARQSSTPMVFLVGLIATTDRDKEAFQEFDIVQMFGSLSKWAAVIDTPARIPDYIARAFHVAMSGRPGPVVLGLPEDVLFAVAGNPEIKIFSTEKIKPAEADLSAIKKTLSGAQKPLIIAGGGGWSDAQCSDLASFAHAAHLPVAAAFRRHDLFDHNDGNYIGELGTGPNPALVERVKQADVILALGARMDEITTQGYTLLQKNQKIIHVYPGVETFGQSFIPDIAVHADPGLTASALAGSVRLDGRSWAGWRDAARKEYLEWTDIKDSAGRWSGADMTQVFKHLRDILPKDAIVTTDAGNFSGWCQRYLRYGRPGRLLAPICGGMGYAVPTAIAASLAAPDKVVLGVCGDGGFMMTGQELATAVHHKAKPIIMVCNNGLYGTIRMHQENHYPGRPSATDLTNPDFVKLGTSYGFYSARVEKASDFSGIWQEAVRSKTPALIEIAMDPRQIRTGSKL